MSQPLTAPSGIPESTVIPRNPDGSPLPKAKARSKRRKTGRYSLYDDAVDKGFIPRTGPLSTDEAEARLDAEDDFNEKADEIRAQVAAKAQVVTEAEDKTPGGDQEEEFEATLLLKEPTKAQEGTPKAQVDTRTPAEKRAATLAAKKAAKDAGAIQ
jgi:hypothetical protein